MGWALVACQLQPSSTLCTLNPPSPSTVLYDYVASVLSWAMIVSGLRVYNKTGSSELHRPVVTGVCWDMEWREGVVGYEGVCKGVWGCGGVWKVGAESGGL